MDALTCASLSHSLSGGESGPHCCDHNLVQSSWFQFLEDNTAGVHSNTLILDDTAVMDQQNLIPVEVSRGWFPQGLQTVGAA